MIHKTLVENQQNITNWYLYITNWHQYICNSSIIYNMSLISINNKLKPRAGLGPCRPTVPPIGPVLSGRAWTRPACRGWGPGTAHLWARASPGPKFIVLGLCLGRALLGCASGPPWPSGHLANYSHIVGCFLVDPTRWKLIVGYCALCTSCLVQFLTPFV